jgi:hypothetical protein
MAIENKILDISYPAAESLANDQYRIVILDATLGTVRRPNAATDIPLGILQNAPGSGEAAVVRVLGISKVVLGGTIARGVIVSCEYVGAADAGKAQTAAATHYPVGILLDGGVEDDLCTCLMGNIIVKA